MDIEDVVHIFNRILFAHKKECNNVFAPISRDYHTKWSCCCSVTKSCLILCDPMNCSMPSFSITLSQSVLKLMSTESVMPSNNIVLYNPLLLLSSIFPNIKVFCNKSALASGDPSIGVSGSAWVLPMNIQDLFPLGLTSLISLQSKVCSRVFCSTTVREQQLFGSQPSLCFNSHIHTWLLEKP